LTDGGGKFVHHGHNCEADAAAAESGGLASSPGVIPTIPYHGRRDRHARASSATAKSTWNQLNLFTGWHECRSTTRVAPRAPRRQDDGYAGLRFDVAHTSVLNRAVVTCNLALEVMDQVWLPVQRHWRSTSVTTARCRALDKKETSDGIGAEQTKLWRRSFDVPPPPVDVDSPEHPINDPRYRLLPPDVLPATECLKDVVARVLPYWHDVIAPQLLAGWNVLITAHWQLVARVGDAISRTSPPTTSPSSTSPTGAPRRYEFDDRLQWPSAGISRRRRRDRRGCRESGRPSTGLKHIEAVQHDRFTLAVYTLPNGQQKVLPRPSSQGFIVLCVLAEGP
jgi:2,3-bisphosphoglycerate-dependent phosphoglycerate mutase